MAKLISLHRSAQILALGSARLCSTSDSLQGPSPVLFAQQKPLKVQVQLLALGSFDGPHAVHVAAVPGVARRENSSNGGIMHRPSAGCWQGDHRDSEPGAHSHSELQPQPNKVGHALYTDK